MESSLIPPTQQQKSKAQISNQLRMEFLKHRHNMELKSLAERHNHELQRERESQKFQNQLDEANLRIKRLEVRINF